VEGERRERKDEGGDEPFHGQTGEGGIVRNRLDCSKFGTIRQFKFH
jgi:hypothetical protein